MSCPWSLGTAHGEILQRERGCQFIQGDGERKQPTPCLGTGIPTEMSPACMGKCWQPLSGLRDEWLQKNSRFSSGRSKSRRSVLGCFQRALMQLWLQGGDAAKVFQARECRCQSICCGRDPMFEFLYSRDLQFSCWFHAMLVKSLGRQLQYLN